MWGAACFGGCATNTVVPADAFLLATALREVAQAPADAPLVCGRLGTAAVRADCVVYAAEVLARTDAEGATALCASVSGVFRDECMFQVAERSGDASRCVDAGRFAEDCRMHAWSAELGRWRTADWSPEQWGVEVTSAAPRFGFATDDPRPWIAAARTVFGRQEMLDRTFCAGWDVSMQEVCRSAGRQFYEDRLNHVRDTGKWTCGKPMPTLLETTEDAELAALRREREALGLCRTEAL